MDKAEALSSTKRDKTDLKGSITVETPSRLQRLGARGMVDAQVVPVFVLSADVDATEMMSWRLGLKASTRDGPIPTVNDVVVRATALVLRDFPRVNAACGEDSFSLYGRINVGMAVTTEAGLLVPVVLDADKKDLVAIAAETKDLAERARMRRLTPDHFAGGTFTVSNLGMFGVSSFTPIINPPQAGILGVGATMPRASGHSMTLTFVGDHRIVNGADGARFLSRLIELLNDHIEDL